MSPNALLVTAAIVITTIAVAFAVWSLRAYRAYVEHQRTIRRTMERFAAIRADALAKSGLSSRPEDLDSEHLVKLLYEMQAFNLADVPRGLIARAEQLMTRQ